MRVVFWYSDVSIFLCFIYIPVQTLFTVLYVPGNSAVSPGLLFTLLLLAYTDTDCMHTGLLRRSKYIFLVFTRYVAAARISKKDRKRKRKTTTKTDGHDQSPSALEACRARSLDIFSTSSIIIPSLLTFPCSLSLSLFPPLQGSLYHLLFDRLRNYRWGPTCIDILGTYPSNRLSREAASTYLL